MNAAAMFSWIFCFPGSLAKNARNISSSRIFAFTCDSTNAKREENVFIFFLRFLSPFSSSVTTSRRFLRIAATNFFSKSGVGVDMFSNEVARKTVVHTPPILTIFTQTFERCQEDIAGRFSELPYVIIQVPNDIRKFREATSDVFLTPLKGLRKD